MRKKLVTKIAKKKLEHARHAARYFGSEAQANDEGINSFRDDMASRYGYKSWDEMPADLRSDATHEFLAGRRAEKSVT